MCLLCCFYTGFCKLHDSDKYTILRLGAIQVCAVVASVHLYNPVQDTYIKSFFEQPLDGSHPSYHFRSALLQLSKKLHCLNLDNMESAFFCALLSMAGGKSAVCLYVCVVVCVVGWVVIMCEYIATRPLEMGFCCTKNPYFFIQPPVA